VSELGAATPRARPYVVVVGGANVDLKAQTAAKVVAATSNPGHTSLSAGGVGRNIAENIARLGTSTELIAAIGDDVLGEWLIAETTAAGVRVGHVHRTTVATGTYTAVLDMNGELIVAVSAMDATDQLTQLRLADSAALRSGATMIVLDGNLAVDLLVAVVEDAAAAGVRVVLDPVSDPKAMRFRSMLTRTRPIYVITPNRTELAVLTGLPVDNTSEIEIAARSLLTRGVQNVWVRLGSHGSLYFESDGKGTPLSAAPVTVRDVTGAGDAMAGAFVHALIAGRTPIEAARFAHAAAVLTIVSEHTVRPDLTVDLIEAQLHRSESGHS
jgi:pseudouridine kinase